jgi:hypothetical protein
MSKDTPVIDTLVGITAVSVEQGTLDAHDLAEAEAEA